MGYKIDNHFLIHVERWVYDTVKGSIKKDLDEKINQGTGKIVTRAITRNEQRCVIESCEAHICWLTRSGGVEQAIDQMLASISSLRGRHLVYFKSGHYAMLWALLMECQTSTRCVHLTYHPDAENAEDAFYQDYRGAQVIPFALRERD